MSAATRARLPWIPASGTVWHVEAGRHFDAIRVSRSIGLRVQKQLDERCGAVICDPWTRIFYFLTAAGATAGWAERESIPCGTATYVVVPPLSAATNVLHWVVEPDPENPFTELVELRAAVRDMIRTAYGPRTEHFA